MIVRIQSDLIEGMLESTRRDPQLIAYFPVHCGGLARVDLAIREYGPIHALQNRRDDRSSRALVDFLLANASRTGEVKLESQTLPNWILDIDSRFRLIDFDNRTGARFDPVGDIGRRRTTTLTAFRSCDLFAYIRMTGRSNASKRMRDGKTSN
jgi:hypothetical protein